MLCGENKVVDFCEIREYTLWVQWDNLVPMRPCIEMTYPEFSGCYALLRQSRVVYVGQSKNVLDRLSQWRNKLRRFQAGKNVDYQGQSRVVIYFTSVRLYPCPRAELNALEKELILLYDPEHNVIKPFKSRVDIAYLAAKAGLDIEQWRDGSTRRYSPKQSVAYRRM